MDNSRHKASIPIGWTEKWAKCGKYWTFCIANFEHKVRISWQLTWVKNAVKVLESRQYQQWIVIVISGMFRIPLFVSRYTCAGLTADRRANTYKDGYDITLICRWTWKSGSNKIADISRFVLNHSRGEFGILPDQSVLNFCLSGSYRPTRSQRRRLSPAYAATLPRPL